MSRNYQEVIDRLFRNPHDEEAFVELDRTFGAELRIYLCARSNSDPSHAEDAYATARVKFLELFRSDHAPVTVGYLWAMAKNCLIDEHRKGRREHPIDSLLPELGIPSDGIDEAIARENQIDALQLIDLLDDRCRYAVESYYLEGRPHRDIARSLEIQPQSVPMTIKRCLDKIREMLGNSSAC